MNWLPQIQARLTPALYAGRRAVAPVNLAPPVISGTGYVGTLFTATPGTWQGTPAPSLAYQWLRNGAPIPAATAATYLCTLADEGQDVQVRVTATNPTGTTQATSNIIHRWLPFDLGSALVAWFDALSPSTLTLNGSNVSEWRDRSANAFHVTQATAANQPTYTPGQLTFEGNTGTTSNPNGDFLLRSTTTLRRPRFVSGVSMTPLVGSTDSNCAVLSYDGPPNPDHWHRVFSFGGAFRHGVSQTLTNSAIASVAPALGVFNQRIVSVGIGGTTTTAQSIRYNGVASNGSALAAAPAQAGTTLLIGVQKTFALQRCYRGDVHEIVLADGTTTASQIERMEGYLAWRQGTVASLPAGHPFRNTPPNP